MTSYLTPAELACALAVPDLTDPAHGPHAMTLVLDELVRAARRTGPTSVVTIRTGPVVRVQDNYDRLGYTADDITRDSRYTRYVDPAHVLRSHTTAAIPGALDRIPAGADIDRLLVVPGLAYRRDVIDRAHVGTPHQLDLWRVSSTTRLGPAELRRLIAEVVERALPGARWRTRPRTHPYTVHGLQLDVRTEDGWLELAEAGVAAPDLLARTGLAPERWSGLAMGVGLDRALMLRKGIPDIRLLRSADPRVAGQLRDLDPWRPVSRQPAIRRDLSIVVAAGIDAEQLGDRVRTALAGRADDLESVELLARTGYAELPEPARLRLGLAAGQVNALLRLTLRPITATLTDAAANALRDQVYLAVHEGPVRELIGSRGPLSPAEMFSRSAVSFRPAWVPTSGVTSATIPRSSRPVYGSSPRLPA